MKTKFIAIIILNALVITPVIADDIYRWTDPVTGKTVSAPYLPPYPIKEKRLAGQLPNGNVIQVILDPNSLELKAIIKKQKEEEAEQRRIAEQKEKEQAIREAEQRQIAEEQAREQAKEQAARKTLEFEQERFAQEKEQAERLAQEKAEQAAQKRLMQEKAEAERVVKEQIAAERLIEERKSEAEEILNSKNDAWDSFFAGPFQGMKDNTEEDSGSNSNQKMGMRVNKTLSSISHAWASLSSSQSQEEIDVQEHPVQENKEVARDKAITLNEQNHPSQEKSESEQLDQKKKISSTASKFKIKNLYLGMAEQDAVNVLNKSMKEALKEASPLKKDEIDAEKMDEIFALYTIPGSTNKAYIPTKIIKSGILGMIIMAMAMEPNKPGSKEWAFLYFEQGELVSISFPPDVTDLLFNAKGISVMDFAKSFMDAYDIPEFKKDCSNKTCILIYTDSENGIQVIIKEDKSIVIEAIAKKGKLKF